MRSRTGTIERVGTPATEASELVAHLQRHLRRRGVPAHEVVLRLQPSEVVQKHIKVPAAARDVLEPVLRNQLERLAPWPASKALLDYQVAPDASESGMLDVQVTITGHNVVEALIAELEALGYAPGVVDCGADAEPEPCINLLPRRQLDDHRARQRLLWVIGLVCGAAMIVGAYGGYDYLQTAGELARLTSRLHALRADEASRGFATQRFAARLVREKREQASVAVVLEALSRALPDHAWLDRLEIDQSMVTLAGTSSNAADIIGRLEASKHFVHAQFSAPTTRLEGGHAETFTIRAGIVQATVLER